MKTNFNIDLFRQEISDLADECRDMSEYFRIKENLDLHLRYHYQWLAYVDVLNRIRRIEEKKYYVRYKKTNKNRNETNDNKD